MLTDYKQIDPETLKLADTILFSFKRVGNHKIMVEVGERVVNTTRAIVMLNQSDERNTPGIRRAFFPAEPADLLMGLGIDVETLDFKLNDNFEEVAVLNYLNPLYKGARIRVLVTETTLPTKLEHVTHPEKHAKRKGRNGDFIHHNGEYIFSLTEAIITNNEPAHVFLKSDFILFAEKHGTHVDSKLGQQLLKAPRDIGLDDMRKFLE